MGTQEINNAHEQALEAAHRKALDALKKKATVENIRAAESAEKALADYRARKAAEADPEERRFKTLLGEDGVLAYLKESGWKIEKSKLHSDQHKIEKEKDGTYAKKKVDEYARLSLQRLDGTDSDTDGLAQKAARLEIEILEEKKIKARHENEVEAGRWVPKDDVESMLAGRAAVLKAGVGPEFIHARAEKLIELVNGDQARAPELIEYWLREAEALFDRYSRPLEFTAPAGGHKERVDEEM